MIRKERKNKMKQVIWILFIFSFSSLAQEDFIEKNTSIEDALRLRDPFKAPRLESNDKKKGALTTEGIFTNTLSADSLALDAIHVKGVLLGQRKRAIITSGEKAGPTYMLSEGSKIANGAVELKAILSSGVVFVEKITNVYGQTEYLETVVPISK